MPHTVEIVRNFLEIDEHRLITDYKVQLGESWEVGGHIYTVVGMSYLRQEVEIAINFLQVKTMTMDEAQELYEEMVIETISSPTTIDHLVIRLNTFIREGHNGNKLTFRIQHPEAFNADRPARIISVDPDGDTILFTLNNTP